MVSMSVTINNQKVLQTLHFQKAKTKDDSKKLTNWYVNIKDKANIYLLCYGILHTLLIKSHSWGRIILQC